MFEYPWSIIIFAVYITLISALIRYLPFFKHAQLGKWYVLSAWWFKLAAATFLMLMYADAPREKSDIFRYYDDASSINDKISSHWSGYKLVLFGLGEETKAYHNTIIETNHWDSGSTPSIVSNNRMIIRYLMLAQWLGFRTYMGTLIITLLLSFIGLFALFKVMTHVFKEKQKLLFVLLFYLPSLTLWTSGITKEALLIFTLGMMATSLFYILQLKGLAVHIPLFCIELFMLFQIRALLALIFLLVFIPFAINYFTTVKRPFLSYFIALFVMASIASESHTIFNKGVFDYLSERRISYIDQALADNAGSLISKQVIEANTISMLKASPKALFDSLLQPVPGQWHKLSAFIAFIENLLILFAILFAFIYKKPKLSYKNLIYFLLIFALIYMLIIGLSIPVAGAIVRYKIFASLFLMLMALLILDTRKLPLASNKP
jgi:hypothetical protein